MQVKFLNEYFAMWVPLAMISDNFILFQSEFLYQVPKQAKPDIKQPDNLVGYQKAEFRKSEEIKIEWKSIKKRRLFTS